MTRILIFLLVLLSAPAHAEYSSVYSATRAPDGVFYSTSALACKAAAAELSASLARYTYTFDYTSGGSCYGTSVDHYCCNGTQKDQFISNYSQHTYDSALHDPVQAGTTDEQCQNKENVVLRVPGGYDPSVTIGAGGCEWELMPGVDITFPNGDFYGTFKAIAALPDLPPEYDLSQPPPDDLDTGWGDPTTGLTETTDPELDCPWSYVTDGTTTYCYSGEDADTGAAYPDGSERIDHYDGSFTIVAPDGTTTEYNAEGGQKAPSTAPTTSDGQDYGGDSSGGVVNAVSSLKDSVGDGVKGLLDRISTEADGFKEEVDPAQYAIDMTSALDQYDTDSEAEQAEFEQAVDAEEAKVNDELAWSVINLVPLAQLNHHQCKDITFGFADHFFTIPCSRFEPLRAMFAFVIYVYTAMSIADVFLNSSRRVA